MFQIDQKTKECSKVVLTEAWDPFDIPKNSTFEDQYIIGGPGDNVEVQEWSDRKPARQRKYAGQHSMKPKDRSWTKAGEYSWIHLKLFKSSKMLSHLG